MKSVRAAGVIFWIFIVWYVIGLALMMFWHVPDALSFSTGVFLVLFALAVYSNQWEWERDKRLSLGRAVLLFVLTMALEAVGTATGFPFGTYDYTAILGPLVLGVPVTIGCAWIGALTASVWLAKAESRLGRAFESAGWMIALDLVLDPVAKVRGFWHWPDGGFYYGIPVQNFIAWYIAAFFLSFLYPVNSGDKRTSKRMVRLYQMLVFMFSLLAFKASLTGAGFIGIAAIILAEVQGRRKS